MRSQKVLWIGLPALLLVLALTYMVKPVTDADFFWHVSNGQWIWDHRTIPLQDPFAYTSPAESSPRLELVLGGYWLSEVIYFLLYRGFGDFGFVLLRLLLVVGFVCGFARYYLSKNHDGLLSLSLICLFLSALLPMFALERPHAMSFLLFFLVVLLLNEFDKSAISTIKNTCSQATILGLLFLLWTFLHPGYLIGAAVLASYAMHVILSSDKDRKIKLLHVSIVVIVPVFFMIIGGDNVFRIDFLEEIISPKSKYMLYNFEQMSLFKYYKLFNNEIILYYLLIMLASLPTSYYLFRARNYFLLILLVCTSYFSFFHVRYVPFMLIVFFISVSYNEFVVNKSVGKRSIVLLSVILLAYFASFHIDNLKGYAENGLVRNEIFPVKAADHILAQQYQRATLFNDAISGGYLSWRLFPRHQVFIDGRTLSESAYIDSLGFALGSESWRMVVDKHDISLIVLNKFGSGDKYEELVARIEADEDWQVTYRDDFSSVLRRKTVSN